MGKQGLLEELTCKLRTAAPGMLREKVPGRRHHQQMFLRSQQAEHIGHMRPGAWNGGNGEAWWVGVDHTQPMTCARGLPFQSDGKLLDGYVRTCCDLISSFGQALWIPGGKHEVQLGVFMF